MKETIIIAITYQDEERVPFGTTVSIAEGNVGLIPEEG